MKSLMHVSNPECITLNDGVSISFIQNNICRCTESRLQASFKYRYSHRLHAAAAQSGLTALLRSWGRRAHCELKNMQ